MKTRDANKRAQGVTIYLTQDSEVQNFEKVESELNSSQIEITNNDKIPWDDGELEIINKSSQKDSVLLNKLLEISENAIIKADKKGNIIIFNKKAEELFFYKNNEILGKKIANLFLNKKKDLISLMKLLRINNEIMDYKIEMVDKNGNPIHVYLSGFLLKNGTNDFNGILLNIKQINKKIKVKKPILESIDNYKTIFNNVNDTIICVDKYGKILDVNDKVEEMFGYKKDEVIGKNFIKLGIVRMRDLPKALKVLKKTFKEGKEQNLFELELKKKNGELIYGEISSKLVKEDGKVKNVINIIRDITTRKKAENSIENVYNRLNYLVSSSPAVIYTCKAFGDFGATYIGENIKKMTGYESEDFITNSDFWANNIHPKDKKRIFKEMEELFVNGHHTHEYRFKYKNGKYYWMRDELNLITDEKGKPKEIIGSWIDITKRKLMEEEIKKQNKKLEVLVDKRTSKLNKINNSLKIEIEKRKKTESALKKSEKSFKNIFENSPIGIYRTKPEGQILMSNPTLLKMLGYTTLDELKNDRNLEKKGFLRNDECLNFKKEIEKNRKVIGYESIWTKRDGTKIYVRENSKAFYDENGNVVYYEGTAEDITEKLKADKEKLIAVKEKASIMDSMGDGLIILGLNGKIKNVNPAFEKILGYKKTEIENKNVKDLIPLLVKPSNIKKISLLLKNALSEKTLELTPKTIPIINKNGKEIYLSFTTTIMKNENNNPSSLIVCLKDISSVIIAEKSIKESEKKFRLFFENVPEYCYMISPDGIILDANKSALKILGYKKNEIIGKQLKKIYAQECYGKIKENYKKWIKTGKLYNREMTLITKAGDKRTVLLSSTAVKDKNSKILNSVSIQKDITEQKKIEEKILIERNKLKTMFDSLEDIVYTISEDYKIEYMNPSSIKEFGNKVGDFCYKVFHESDKVCPNCDMKETLKGKIVKRDWYPTNSNKIYNTIITPLKNSDGTISRLEFDRDITDKKRVEENLRNSAEKWQTTFDSITDIVTVISPEHEFIEVNEAGCKALGMKRGEIIGKKCYELVHGTDSPIKECPCTKTIKSKKVGFGEYEYNGQCMKLSAWPIFDKNDNIIAFTHTVKDITDEKNNLKEINRLKEFNEKLINNMTEGIILEDENGIINFSNPAFTEMLGYEPNELIGKQWTTFVPKEEQLKVKKANKRRTKNKSDRYEMELIKKNGERIPVLVSGTPYFKDGKYSGLQAVFTNITNRKKAEIELNKLASVTKFSGDLINIATPDGKMVFLNEAGGKMLGINPKDVTEHKIIEVIPSHRMEIVTSELLPTLMKCDIWEGELDYINIKTKKLTPVHAMAFTIKDEKTNEIKYLANVSRDITKEKEAEKDLKMMNEKLQNIFNFSPSGIMTVDLDGKITSWSPKCEEIFGWKKDEVIGKFNPTVPNKMKDFYFKTLREKNENLEIKTLTKDNSLIDLSISTTPLYDEKGKIAGSIGVMTDISEKKKTEDIIKKSEEKYRELVEKSNYAIISDDKNGCLTYFNEKFPELFGYSENEMKNQSLKTLVHPEDLDFVMKLHKQRINGRKVQSRYEFRGIKKDGSNIYLEVHTVTLKDNKKIIGTHSYLHDITERKEAEILLKKSEERFRDVAESTGEWIWEVDKNGLYTYVSPVVEEILGYKPEEIVGKKHFYDYFTPDVREELKNGALQAFESKVSFKDFINPNTHKNGKTIILQTSGKPILDENGNLLGYRGADTDITERIESEKALTKSEERFRDVTESTGEWIWEVDKNGLFTYASPVSKDILGFKPEEIVGKKHFYDFFTPDAREGLKKSAFEIFQNKVSFNNFLNPNTHKNGKKVIFETSGKPIFDEIGNLIGFRGANKDITQRQKRENEIIALKDYNEEILHSVKSGIVVTDKHLNVISWNDYMEESYGIKKSKILQKNLIEHIPELKSKKFDKVFSNIVLNGKIFKEYMIKHKTKNGFRYYNLTFAPRRNKDNKIMGILMSWDDVTELAEMGRKLTTIYELTDKMILSQDIEEILHLGLDAIQKVLKFHHCAFLFHDKNKNELHVKAHRGYSKNIDKLRIPIKGDKGFVNKVYSDGKIINIPDIRLEDNFIAVNKLIKSEIAVPLNIGNKTIGVLNVESNKLNAFSESDEKLLTTLATEISTALNNINLNKETKRKANALASLNHFGKAISSKLNMDEIIKTLYKQISFILDTNPSNN